MTDEVTDAVTDDVTRSDGGAWRGSLLRVALAVGVSVALLHRATLGFRAFTTETARAIAVAEDPQPVPAIALVDADGQRRTLRDSTRVTIVQFFYSRCTTVCATAGDAFHRLQATLDREDLGARVRLLSVSFDPAVDTPAQLRTYAAMHHADPARWTMATVAQVRDLDPLLRAFGVRVIPDGAGGFVHNAAFHVVNREGRLIAIEPIAEPPFDSRRGSEVLSRDAFDAAIAATLEVVRQTFQHDADQRVAQLEAHAPR